MIRRTRKVKDRQGKNALKQIERPKGQIYMSYDGFLAMTLFILFSLAK
jgi:hypothetical protein